MSHVDSPELVDVDYAAAYCSVSRWTILNWLKARTLPGVKQGRRWYIRKDRLEQMFDPANHSSTEGQSKRDSPSSAVATTNHSGAVSSGLALRGSSEEAS